MSNTKQICTVTHGQVAEGTCPWCDTQLPKNPKARSVAKARSGKCHWDVDALSAAIEHDDTEVRSSTISNLMLDDGPDLDVAVSLLAKAMGDQNQQNRHFAENALTRLGQDITPEQVQELEDCLIGSPHEVATRILLLGYYFLGQRQSRSARETRCQHALWLIGHAPGTHTVGTPDALVLERENAERYAEAKDLWLKQVENHPTHTTVIGNAASFFVLNDKQLSEQLYKEAQKLDPDNPIWSERLGHLYLLQSKGGSLDSVQNAKLALRELLASETSRVAQAGNSDEQKSEDDIAMGILSRIHALPSLAKAAVIADEFDDAHRYATELLTLTHSDNVPEYFRGDGNAIHYANLVLGHCALRSGDLEGAKQHLLASGRTKGSPNLGSFGPNMSLAKELLEQGERDIVLDYFALCRDFWKSGPEYLDQCTEEVRRAEVPDFGANLDY
jgi:tetratricopeptide (TPR) repeat protein